MTRSIVPVASGFIPPPYPYERLAGLAREAEQVPGGMVDLSVGTPCDPMPAAVAAELTRASATGVGYPPSIGTSAFREAACGWMHRRFGVSVEPSQAIACLGTKELVASLPHMLHLRDPSRDTVLYPAVSYPTYAMGAQLAGCRAVPVPLDRDWHLDLTRIAEEDARRALVLWVNEPGNPTGSAAGNEHLGAIVDWARERGIIVASDECYAEFTYAEPTDDGAGRANAGRANAGRPSPLATVLSAGTDGVLALHSLSKRSNMAGLRVGFLAGDTQIVGYLGEVRKHAGMMVPGPIQAAAVVALGDDTEVDVQRERYAQRRSLMLDHIADFGLVHDGGPATFYLWARVTAGNDEQSKYVAQDGNAGNAGWAIAARLAAAGTLVAPGDLYGPDGAAHVRIALVQPIERLQLAIERLTQATG